ncbi:AAA family ATPase [Allochromatium humboldtianum]|uniref:AAA family ATPase n=1 Tax=Allochromatium humboldtianum TaxID=504901 RepID=A0A850RAJ5_9GAMM|nr:AAA family ATPase [Allochromatium humboldtianum]NVZ08302.1 AAA family ATPase [Allochromatium humboldtianum]
MKLVSLRVRHYRLHRERQIAFDPSLTLIGGPNETGKSTLVEAAHRALFLSHRRTGKELEAMRSQSGREPPEIELVFEQRGRPYRLLKRFSGSRGHAELMRLDTAERWQSAEAELALAAVLGYAAPVSSNQAQSQWAHLWIWQGAAGVDPTGQIEREQATLLERLQAQGGTAVMQSALDARLADRFLTAVEQTFTATGKPRAGSSLKQTETALQSATQRLATCQARTEALTTARRDHAQALQRRAEAAEAIPRLEARITELRSQLDEAQRLAQQGSELKRSLDETTKRYEELVTADAKLRALTETAQEPDAQTRPHAASDVPPTEADPNTSRDSAVVESETLALQTNATVLEWISGSGPVTLDGEPLQPGTTRLITATSELRIGDNHFRLRSQTVQEADESTHRTPEPTDSIEDSAIQAARLAAAALQTLLELHGDETQRQTQIAEALSQKSSLEQEVRDLDERLVALQPDRLTAELVSHQSSLTTQQDALDEAKQRIAATLALLQRDGATDPYADELEAQADLERAEEAHRIQLRRAKAMQHLADLFREEQQRLSERFTEPLIGKIGDYLECLFGPEGRAALKLQDGAFQGLALIRPAGPFAFEVLSGGAREQLGAAVRLAIAEVLAENHGGSLPLVFDDAFANSDPERIQSLHRMLELAARRGLQIIILTCNPADYSSLAARTILL